MRYINKKELIAKIDDAWLDKAEQALQALVPMSEEERKIYIGKSKNAIWTEIKGQLCIVSQDKCWYSERKLSQNELEVDHFRPKLQVAKVKHPGYWWKTYDWNNFRLSTSLVNKRKEDYRNKNKQIRGKGTYFPLEDGRKRTSTFPPDKTGNEKPLLIDPTVPSDIELLSCATAFGKITPKFKEKQNKPKFLRAKISIELYHLNDGHLIRERFDIYSAIDSKSTRLDELITKEDDGGLLPDEESEKVSLWKELSDVVNSGSSYSFFAKKCLMEKWDRGWNMELLAAS